jgi:pyruvate formate lyase activating enzyme
MSLYVAYRPVSLVDYPGKVAAVIFFEGCNLRCPWCQNRELVLCEADGSVKDYITLENALERIGKRKNVLGGVAISGGEPTLRPELAGCIAAIKGMGLKVKLDTNGMRPNILENLILSASSRPDFIALDIKLPPPRYREIGGNESSGECLEKSIAIIKDAGENGLVDYEFRSLALPEPFFTKNDMDELKAIAGERLTVRPFVSGNCLDESWNGF